MDIDNLLFGAEEDIIQKEIEKKDDVEELMEWAENHNLSNFESVKEKVKSLCEKRESQVERKKFGCKDCPKQFERKNELLVHIRAIHENVLFKCGKCDKGFAYQTNRVRHEKKCKGPPKTSTGKGIKCRLCDKVLTGHKQIRLHNEEHKSGKSDSIPQDQTCKNSTQQDQTCENTIAQESTRQNRETVKAGTSTIQHNSLQVQTCENTDMEIAGPSTDQSSSIPIGKNPSKEYRCRTCNERFQSRRELYLHRNTEHQSGEGPSADIVIPEDQNEQFKVVYKANTKFIFEEDKDDGVQATINIPLQNDISVNDIMKHVEQISSNQTKAFKIQFSFGLILQHKKTGQFRYFIPARNQTLLIPPFLIQDNSSLKKLRNKLEEISLQDFLQNTRDNTEWKLYYLTNLQITIYRTPFLMGAPTDLPGYIKNNKNVCSLTSSSDGRPYTDNLCIFRCLSMLLSGRTRIEQSTQVHYNKYMEYIGQSIDKKDFEGLDIEDIHQFERCFEVNVNIFSLQEDESVLPVRRSHCHYTNTMNLNLFENHLSYISNMKAYSKRYQCQICQQFYPTAWRCLQHERRCENKTKLVYPGGFHHHKGDIFTQLDEYGIHVDRDLRHYPYFIVYDFEAMLKSNVTDTQTGKLRWDSEHHPISVSICSNVEGYLEPQCFVDPNCDLLVETMIEHMEAIAEKTLELANERWEEVFIDIDSEIDNWDPEDPREKQMVKALEKLRGKFEFYISQIPVLGFNSSNYDLNLIKKYIAKHMNLHECDSVTIKKNNAYTCISNGQLKFLDILNFLAGGTSYSGFLKAYNIAEQKGFFPYEYLTHHDVLKETQLPPHEAFYSNLKEKNISVEEYQYCQKIWRDKNMQTLQDFLIWYNNRDVGPFVQAVEKLQSFYFERKIDVFKIAMSVPGIARQMLFQSSQEMGASFALFGEEDKDLFKTVKNNIIGGPSIIFHRYSKVKETYIRHNKNKPCRRIVGFDANALYLWAIGQPMPTGTYVRRLRENDFKPEARDKYMVAYHWMDWLSKTRGYDIRHRLNNGKEKRVGAYLVDGHCRRTDTIFQYHGCYFHCHDCILTKHIKNEKWLAEKERKFNKTLEISQFIRDQGFELVEIWECEYRELEKQNQALQQVIDERSPTFFTRFKRQLLEKDILDAVLNDTLFGMIEVDINVPEVWPTGFNAPSLSPYDYFQEMSPLFCTSEIPFDIIGQHMQEHVEKYELSKKPRRLLVGAMKARKLLLASPLLQWYLKHGLEVTHIYQVIEYTPMTCFETFVTNVTEARRQGDVNPDLKVIADTTKTIGNSAYGGLIMDKQKHKDVTYVMGESEAQNAVNQSNFIGLTHLEDEMYEIEKAKQKIHLDLPISLGYQILQYGKLRMLEFYYDFMDKYCERKDFVYLEMDTDSAYMAISAPSLDDIIKPNMKNDYLHGLYGFCHQEDIKADNIYHWFPRKCCTRHAQRDKRTPGLFKVEFEGDQFVGLCSKTYMVNQTKLMSLSSYITARRIVRKAKGLKLRKPLVLPSSRNIRETKFSCKGVSKRAVSSPLRTYKKVLETATRVSAINKGFRARNNSIFSYQQERNGFSYFYCKRQVLDNGIDTRPLNITISPEK